MTLTAASAPRVVGAVPFHGVNHAHLDLSPDGRHVALLSSSAVELFDQHGERLALLRRHDVRACGCFLDDRRLLVGRDDGSLLLFSVDALALAGTLRDADALALGEPIACAATSVGQVLLSPDGATVAVACGEPTSKAQKPDKLVRLLDAATLRPGMVLKGMRRRVVDLAFAPDGVHLAAAGDAVVRVFELAKAKPVAELGDADDAGVAWRPDGTLLTLGRTHGLRAWSLPDRAVLAQHPFPQQTLRGPRVTPDGDVIVASGGSFLPMTVHRLDAALSVVAAPVFDRMPPWPGAPRVSPDGAVWVAQGLAFRRLRGPALDPEPMGDGHADLVVHSAVHPDGRWAATGDMVGNVRVWDLDAGRVVYAFPVETTLLGGSLVSTCQVKELAFSAGAPRVFLVTERGGIRSWDALTGQPGWSRSPGDFGVPLRVFPTPEGDAVLAVRAAKQGTTLALVDAAGGTLWSTTTDILPRHVHWEPDAVVLVDLCGSVRLRRADGALTDRWMLPPTSVAHNATALAVSDDGALAAATGNLGRLVAWKIEGAQVLCALDPRHHGISRPTGLAWTRDGGLLVLDADLRVDERDPVSLAPRGSLTLSMPARWRVHLSRDARRMVVPTHQGPWLVYDLTRAAARPSP